MKRLLILAAVLMMLTVSCKKSTPQPTDDQPTPAQSLIARLDTLRKRGYMYGHQDDPFYGITWQWEQGRSDTYELMGDYPAVLGFDLGGLEEGHDKNLDSVPFNWIREEAIKHYQRGGILTFSWHPHNPAHPEQNAWYVEDTTVVGSVLPDSVNHELFASWMQMTADFLKTLKTDDGEPIPFILRPWHEYNGSWFWWGQKLCSDQEFKDFWRMTHDFYEAQLPGQIVWSCSPNLQGGWSEEQFLSRWPGDDIIDLIGEDCYQWGTEEDFISQTSADVEFLSRYALQHGKLFAITECGMQNSPTPDWWGRVFRPVIERADQPCYFLPWRNWHADHFGASKDASTADDFKAYATQAHILFLKDIQ